jgi:rRNA maturation endonuclease Nob1
MTNVECPQCKNKFDVFDEGVCPECGYFYKIKTREMYKLEAVMKR